MEIAGRSFLITGGTRGIGRGLVEMLLAEGGRVAFSGRDPRTVEEAARALKRRGGEVLGVAGDVGKDDGARRLARTALEAFGRVDVLVNNAAVLAPPATVVETPPETWEEVLRVNVIGTVNLIRHVLPSMQERRSGLIINLSSGWGRVGEARVASYCASKFAVEGLSQSVAEEAGKGVVVLALNPGIIATEMLARAFEGDVSRYPTPADIAPRWKNLLRKLEPSWNGRSLDLDDFQ